MMRPRTAIAIFAAGMIVLAAGWFFGPHSAALTRGTVARGTLMFPGLVQRLQDAAKIEITSKGHTLELDRTGNDWGVAERGGYPAQPQKVRALLTGLTELRLDEPRTADPAFFPRLGLDDPSKPEGAGDLVRVLDKDGKTVAAVIVGHSRVRTAGTLAGMNQESVYVRAPDQDQTWLASGRVEADADPQSWLERDIMNFPAAKIARVDVAPAAPTGAGAPPHLSFASKDGKLAMTEPAEHPALDDSKLGDVDRALEDVTFEDVRPAGAGSSGQPQGVGTFDITDGPTVTATVNKNGGTYWVRFAATGKDADSLQHRIAGWDYKIDSWRAQNLVPTLDTLKAATPPMAAPPTPAQPTLAQPTPAPSAPAPAAPTPAAPTPAAPSQAPPVQ